MDDGHWAVVYGVGTSEKEGFRKAEKGLISTLFGLPYEQVCITCCLVVHFTELQVIFYDNYSRQHGWGTFTPSMWKQQRSSIADSILVPPFEYTESYLSNVPSFGV